MRKFTRQQLILTPATILIVAGFVAHVVDRCFSALVSNHDHSVWIWLPLHDYRIRLLLDANRWLQIRSYFGTWQDIEFDTKFEATPLLMMFCGYLLLFGLIPDKFLNERRAMRVAAGHCATCDYNLTGNSTGICPECGMPVAKSPPP